jgi:hypothetical protein
MSMSIELKIDANELAKLAKIPIWLQHNAIDKALTAMAKPIAAKAKAVLPSSRKSNFGNATQGPTRKKWSSKYKSNPMWQVDSGKEVMHKVVKTKNGAIAFVGPRHPQGNKQQFNNSKKGRRVFYWGKDAGQTYHPPYRFMDRAFDETRSQQDAAFVSSIQSSFGSMNLG